MDVTYRCKCMHTEVTVSVPDQLPYMSDEGWMNLIVARVKADHDFHSPNCVGDLQLLKVPIEQYEAATNPKPALN